MNFSIFLLVAFFLLPPCWSTSRRRFVSRTFFYLFAIKFVAQRIVRKKCLQRFRTVEDESFDETVENDWSNISQKLVSNVLLEQTVGVSNCMQPVLFATSCKLLFFLATDAFQKLSWILYRITQSIFSSSKIDFITMYVSIIKSVFEKLRAYVISYVYK